MRYAYLYHENGRSTLHHNMNKPLFITILAAAIILAGGTMWSTAIGASAVLRVKAMTSQQLSVTGSAERMITSDTAKWTLSVVRNVDPLSLKDGSLRLAADVTAVTAELRKSGIDQKGITIQPLTVTQACESQSATSYDATGNQVCGKITGYAVQQTIIVESKDVHGLTTAAQELPGRLLQQDILLTTKSLEYFYSDLQSIKFDMLSEATKNAKDRADRIAGGTGVKLGKIRTADMGVFQITSVNSTDISDYGMYDTTSIDKKVTAVVRATFSIE